MKYSILEHLIKDNKTKKLLFEGNFGLEREIIRVDQNGRIAQTSHPFPNNKYISLDFSESQIEIISPLFKSIKECKIFIEIMSDIIHQELKDEYLWNYSMPPKIENENEINIAFFSDQPEKNEYRKYLAKKYGKIKQTISGIHFNFSFEDEFLKKIFKDFNYEGKNFKDFKNDIYLKISRKYIEYQWFSTYLFGFTPVADESFFDECSLKDMKKVKDFCFGESSKSIRNSDCGYQNKEKYIISYYSLDKYVDGIENLVKEGKIISNIEYYNCVRLKNSKGFEFLKDEGIEYLEFRNIDIFPFEKSGINIKALEFLHFFFIYILFEDEKENGFIDFGSDFCENRKIASFFGENDEVKLANDIDLKTNTSKLLEKMNIFFDKLSFEDFRILSQEVFENRNNSSTIKKNSLEKGYTQYFLELAKKFKKESLDKEYTLKGFEDMELSTQILMKSALKRCYDVEILDRKENFISISNGKRKEYIIQATKTSLDNYASILAMENKIVTKKILSENNITVAEGKNYTDIELAKSNFYFYKNKKIVIKPKSANFGIGITIFKNDFSEEDFLKGLEIAFEADKEILIEEFLEGKEYRIFVLDDKVVGVLNRVPANVKGNGIHDITKLVEEKNKDILRGNGYITPLEKISLGQEEKLFLSSQKIDFNYIPKKDELIYLRENSNISTGGDSIDFTDEIDESYKDIAVKSAQYLRAKICGVDMMIQDMKSVANKENYGVMELNFNPAIHIHCYPFSGKNRNLGEKILDLLF